MPVIFACTHTHPFRSQITVLTGDLNMIPSDKAMQYLLGKVEYKGTTCDFTDVWLMDDVKKTHDLGAGAQGLENGYTFNNLNAKLEKRIDFVLVRGKVDHAVYDYMEVFGARAKDVDGIPPSDHLGLVVKMSRKDDTACAAGSSDSDACGAASSAPSGNDEL